MKKMSLGLPTSYILNQNSRKNIILKVLPPPPPENQSSMVKEKKKAVKKHVCPEQGCPKSITGYTQSHNLKDHMRKKHNSI